MPGDIVDEIAMATVFLAFAEVPLRWPLDGQLHATDATPNSLGSTVASLPEKIGRELHRLGVCRGEHTRLDWGEEGAPWLPSPMPRPHMDVDQLFRCLSLARETRRSLPEDVAYQLTGC